MLKVYLDTQDYANLYKDDIHPDLKIIKTKLLQYKAKGVVKFPLSFLILFEFVTDYQTEFEADRQKRSEFLSQLCGADNLPYFMDIALKNQVVDDSTWIPSGSLIKFSVERMLSVFRYELKNRTNLPRKLRRDLQNPLYLRSFLKQYLLRQISQGKPDMNWHLELDQLSFDFFKDYLLGKISEGEANLQFRESVFEPSKFFNIWYQRFSNKNALSQFYGGSIDKFHELSLQFKNEMPALLQNLNNSRVVLKKRIKEAANAQKVLSELGIETGYKLPKVPTEIDWDQFYESVRPSETLELFSDPLAALFKSYFNAIFHQQFSPKKSDVVDIFHSVYIDKVDLWRTDRSFANFLARSNYPSLHRIVPTLQELPDRIEKLLA